MPYTKTVWTSGLPLTIARLNNMENGISAVDTTAAAALPASDARVAPAGTSGAGVVSGGAKIQSGKTAPGTTSGTVTFPSAFSTAPVVTLGLQVSGANGMIYLTATPTTTGFSWTAIDRSAGPITPANIHWAAYGT